MKTMGEEGLEPSHFAVPDPKSGASTNSAIRSLRFERSQRKEVQGQVSGFRGEERGRVGASGGSARHGKGTCGSRFNPRRHWRLIVEDLLETAGDLVSRTATRPVGPHPLRSSRTTGRVDSDQRSVLGGRVCRPTDAVSYVPWPRGIVGVNPTRYPEIGCGQRHWNRAELRATRDLLACAH